MIHIEPMFLEASVTMLVLADKTDLDKTRSIIPGSANVSPALSVAFNHLIITVRHSCKQCHSSSRIRHAEQP